MCETLWTGTGQEVEQAVANTSRTTEVSNDGKLLHRHCFIIYFALHFMFYGFA